MRIAHFSDWHGNFRELPPADLYVATGDLLPNFCRVKKRDERKRGSGGFGMFGGSSGWFDKQLEVKIQREWVRQLNESGGFRRKFFPDSQTPVVCVRGNHDFVDLAPLFDGGPTHEIVEAGDEFTLGGLKFSGFRGINYIQNNWTDELHGDEQGFRASKIPRDVDVIVTHAPPHGVLDYFIGGGNLGMQSLTEILNKKTYDDGAYPNLKLMLFGHIHEQGGQVIEAPEIGVKFSNAACKVNVIDV